MEEMRGWHSGKIRRLFKKDCEVCEVYFWVPKHLFEKSRYCSFKCASQGKQRRVELHCAECGKSIWKSASKLANSKSGFVFCNRLCKETAQQTGGRVPGIQPAHYREMHGRAFLIRTRGHRCEICKLEEWLGQPIALERDHIDGDSANNTESNLRLLCPNCHAQTPTFCGRNRGRGRKSLRGDKPKINPHAEKGIWPSTKELARLLWVRTLESLAQEIGVSSSMVRRRAIRLGLSRPERGYWIRKQGDIAQQASTAASQRRDEGAILSGSTMRG